MKIVINDKINLYCKNLTEVNQVRHLVTEKFVFKNPAYEEAIKNNYSTMRITPNIILYSFIQSQNRFEIPGGAFDFLYLLKDTVMIESITDDRTITEEIDFEHNITPRDEQQKKCVETFKELPFNSGVLQAMCAFGKSFVALMLLNVVRQRTLVVVDQRLILEQWIEYITENTTIKEEDIGIINQKTLDYKDKKIVIATAQTLKKYDNVISYLSDNIGFLIIDECHIVASDTFQTIAGKMKPKYRLGLSATPNRDDGLSFLVESTLGGVFYKSDRYELCKSKSIIEPNLRVLYLTKDKPYELNGEIKKNPFQQLVEVFEEDMKVVFFISYLVKVHYDKGDYQLMIIRKKEYAKKYKKMLVEKFNIPEDEVVLMFGEMNKKDRKKNIELAKSGKIKVIITTNLLDKAVSINRLNILHNIYPSKEMANTTQRVGRVARTHPGKEYAIVYDYIYDHPIFFYQFHSRNKGNRLIAYKECTVLPDYLKDLISYIFNRINGNNSPIEWFPTLKRYKNKVIINLDDIGRKNGH